jgi:hypothetical protein
VYLEYLVEFENEPYINILEPALNGRSWKDIIWSLKIEPFSAFSFNMMRTNIYLLCSLAENARKREILIKGASPKMGKGEGMT